MTSRYKYNQHKAFTGLIVIMVLGCFLYIAIGKMIRRHNFKHRIPMASHYNDTQQDNGPDQEESIPVYFYKMQSDLVHPFSKCKHKCHLKKGFSSKRDAVIVFQAPSLFDRKPLTKAPGQLWVFFSMEPPTHHPPSNYLKKWRNMFNWTLGYRRDADILHTYGRFHLLPDAHKRSNLASTWNSQSNKSIVFVSHCGVASKRLKYLETLNSFYGIDIYGNCGRLKCPKSDWGNCHDKIRNYKFYLAFENSLCKDYITEKMFKVYWRYSNAIPVGRGQTQHDVFLPPNSYLDTSKYNSIKELAEHMWRLSKNEREAIAYFKWNTSFFVDHDDSDRSFCELCRRIHDPGLMRKHTRLYRDIDTWLRGSEGTNICTAPTDLA